MKAGSLERYLVIISLFTFTLFVSFSNAQFNTYNQLYRTYGAFESMPLNVSVAIAAGWAPISNQCNPLFGIAYASSSSGPGEWSEAFLYFTSAGQLSGFGARVWDTDVPQYLIPNFWVPVQGKANVYDIAVIFRSSNITCSGQTSPYIMGDRILVNGMFNIPLTSVAAKSAGWVEGACIPWMGTHWAYDLSTKGSPMTWNASTLMPIMPMYGPEDTQIKAVLIASTTVQYTEPLGDFEGPIPNFIMCGNWCDSNCHFTGTSWWSIMHWFFTDYVNVGCTGASCEALSPKFYNRKK